MLPSVLWPVLIAVLLAAAIFAVMVLTTRPEQGWGNRLREIMATPGRGEGALAEHRAAAHDDGVGLAEIMAQAEPESGYLEVPQRFEDRFEELATALSDRVRAGRHDD